MLEGRPARFGGGWIVDRHAMLDIIDRLRSAVPREVEDARTVLRDRHNILDKASEDATIVVNKARDEADQRLNSHDMVLDAQRRASEIADRAQTEAREALDTARREAAAIRGDATTQAVEQAFEADRYSLDMLRRLDSQLSTIEASVRAGIDQLDQKLQREEEMAAVDTRDAELRREQAPV